ncbi:Oligosaccharyl transferase STT3 subunit [Nitrosococcus halophilus Nc 4]|uniref:Oligosaccharyl transferase STT3 subunit n=1 Tax=Nitrosococcus halophilus (strain Nc4) TaxID=472759 RepID=D5BVE1_NITHN|nr:STT3 domain-containing protein [Nitrosococcus halophilus]ADE13569.1 Oligosaccharyl transferase STT3 subunit [Nitrosococcus halophilus Nc 4]
MIGKWESRVDRALASRLGLAVGLALIFLFAFTLRFDNLSFWLDNPERTLFGDPPRPLMLTVDSYIYLDLGRDLLEGTYESDLPTRHVPQGAERPPTAPLLAVMLAGLQKLTGAAPEWIAIVLPPFLGALIVLPVYMLGSLFATLVWSTPSPSTRRIAGLAAAAAAAASPYFVFRSSIGWFDTDSLNVVFSALAAALALRAALARDQRQRIIAWVLYSLVLVLFLWWWNTVPHIVFGLWVLPGLATLLFHLPRGWELVTVAALVLLGLVGAVAIAGWQVLNPVAQFQMVQGLFTYIAEQTGWIFPETGQAVSEQQATGWDQFLSWVPGGWFGLAMMVIGYALLVWRAYRAVMVMASLVIVTALSATGYRFNIFGAPVFGVGVGIAVAFFWVLLSQRSYRTLVTVPLLGVTLWGAVAHAQGGNNLVPRRYPIDMEAMIQLGELSAPNAVVWAMWGHGNPLHYYARRGVVADGVFHSGRLQWVLHLPLAKNNPRLAANWMQFYVTRGYAGMQRARHLFGGDKKSWAEGLEVIQRMFIVGPEESYRQLIPKMGGELAKAREVIEYFFPAEAPPVMLYLDHHLARTPWFKLGKWDLNRQVEVGDDHTYLPFRGYQREGERLIAEVKGKQMVLDLNGATMTWGERTAPLQQVRMHDGKRLLRMGLNPNADLVLSVNQVANYGAVASRAVADALLPRLFVDLAYDNRYFTLRAMMPSFYQIWEVRGEELTAEMAARVEAGLAKGEGRGG